MDYEFLDNFDHTIDAKGRLVLPSAFRDAFTEGGVVTWLGGYAALFTPDGWEKYRRRLMNETNLSRDELQFMIGNSSRFEPDAQHRVPISRKLRDKIGIEREVAVVGSLSHVAIYPRDRWEQVEDDMLGPDETGLDLKEKVRGFGFL